MGFFSKLWTKGNKTPESEFEADFTISREGFSSFNSWKLTMEEVLWNFLEKDAVVRKTKHINVNDVNRVVEPLVHLLQTRLDEQYAEI
jgi:pantothenate kinase